MRNEMERFYYVDTGHRVGLDRFRRAVAVLNALGDDEITLLCSDFRIAHEARKFGIKKTVGIDVVRNIVNITERGDSLIFDSAEANPVMLEDMRSYFSHFVRVSDDPTDFRRENELLLSPYFDDALTCKAIMVDNKYFQDYEKTIEIGFFYGDDDYEKDLGKHLDILDGLDVEMMLGFYYFLDYEQMLQKKFPKYHEFEEYDTFVCSCKVLITSSPQAVLQNLATGGRPIYLVREDYDTGYEQLFAELNVPIVRDFDKEKLENFLEKIASHIYNKLPQNSDKVVNYLKDKFYL